MNLTLKDVYNLRKGIIDFTNSLFTDSTNFETIITQEQMTELLKYVKLKVEPKLKMEEGESKEDFNKRRKQRKQAIEKEKIECINETKKFAQKGIVEYARHIIALETYEYLIEKKNELIESNPGMKNDPIIKEFSKNVDIFKSLIEKNGVYNFEIVGKNKKDKLFYEKLRNGITNQLTDDNKEFFDKYGLINGSYDTTIFLGKCTSLFVMDNLNRFSPKNIDERNSTFYGLLKNAGYSFTRGFNTNYYQMPTEIIKCPSGYKFNENGEMVAKESTGFFSKISNFFGRLFNSGKASQYNNELNQAKNASFDKKIMDDLDDMYKLEEEKKLVNLGKEFDKLTDAEKDFEIEEIAKTELYRKQEKENDKKALDELLEKQEKGEEIEPIAGPGLEQLD